MSTIEASHDEAFYDSTTSSMRSRALADLDPAIAHYHETGSRLEAPHITKKTTKRKAATSRPPLKEYIAQGQPDRLTDEQRSTGFDNVRAVREILHPKVNEVVASAVAQTTEVVPITSEQLELPIG